MKLSRRLLLPKFIRNLIGVFPVMMRYDDDEGGAGMGADDPGSGFNDEDIGSGDDYADAISAITGMPPDMAFEQHPNLAAASQHMTDRMTGKMGVNPMSEIDWDAQKSMEHYQKGRDQRFANWFREALPMGFTKALSYATARQMHADIAYGMPSDYDGRFGRNDRIDDNQTHYMPNALLQSMQTDGPPMPQLTPPSMMGPQVTASQYSDMSPRMTVFPGDGGEQDNPAISNSLVPNQYRAPEPINWEAMSYMPIHMSDQYLKNALLERQQGWASGESELDRAFKREMAEKGYDFYDDKLSENRIWNLINQGAGGLAWGFANKYF